VKLLNPERTLSRLRTGRLAGRSAIVQARSGGWLVVLE
jgi:hypothetical protein